MLKSALLLFAIKFRNGKNLNAVTEISYRLGDQVYDSWILNEHYSKLLANIYYLIFLNC